ncbi:DMT family transporter [uncultured Propionivibrio sp.]|uniref:DMT family transporter n=1 Tax=uncultured Propionivibrio sp. TaxID=426737 RepID=UPI0029C0A4D7|nr:DMT family transporter [uncultured Propionivibrio sp.]
MTHRRAVSLLILATLLWSIAGVVTRQLDAARSFEVTFWRSLFNALALVLALSVMRGAGFWSGFRRAGWPVWMSGVCWALMYTAFMVAMTLTTVANVLVMIALGPLVTALFSRVVLDHRLPWRTWAAIVLAGGGIAWMYGAEALSGVSLVGTVVAGVVPLAAAVNWIVLQFVASRSQSGADMPDMMPAVLIGATLSAAATLPVALPLQASLHDVVWLALLGVVQLAIPCLIVVRLSRELPAAEISLYDLLEVIFGVTWAWLWGGETPSASTLLGGGLVIVALVFNEMLALRRT